MGGLLAADIALVFRHRIIGVVNFDVPFLGMHPGIIKAGLGSLFNSPPTPQDEIVQDSYVGKKPSRMSTIFNPQPADPNYNPSFENDIKLPVRKGWDNTLHWLGKHYKDGLKDAAKSLVKSHFEFGSAMADYRELKDRYAKVRALEEEDESKRMVNYPGTRSVPRIRFVNYYTASTGRPKKPKSPKSPSPTSPSLSRATSQQLLLNNNDLGTIDEALASADHLPQTQGGIKSGSTTSSEPEMRNIDPEPMVDTPRASTELGTQQDDGDVPVESQASQSAPKPIGAELPPDLAPKPDGPPNLPEIPPIPQEPPFVDLMQFSNKTERKAAEKEHDQALKAYQKEVKARNKVIKERTKMEEKWEKEKAKEEKEQAKEKKKKQEEEEKEEKKRMEEQEKEEKKKREEQDKEEKRRQEEAKPMSAEDLQRQKEREQRQAEAQQREAEARSRQREADLRDGKIPAEEQQAPIPPTPTAASDVKAHTTARPDEVDEDLGATQLGDTHPQQDMPQPSTTYSFSQNAVMDQTPPPEPSDSLSLSATEINPQSPGAEDAKPKKLGKFCMLPPKDAYGNKDPTWIRVFMEDMDEVTAHTSLFFVNETYERLVGDVGARIEEWVCEAESVRLVREMSGL
jgi:hypothetical protein